MKKCFHLSTFWILALLLAATPISAQSQNSQALNWFSLGLKEKDPQKKILAYKKAIELDPSFVEALYNLGLSYKKAQDYAQAESFLLKALNARVDKTKTETKAQILYELAGVSARQGKSSNFEDYMRGAKAITSDAGLRTNILVELGRFYHEQERFEEALAEFREGQKLSKAASSDFASLIRRVENDLEMQKLFEAAENAAASGNLRQAKTLLEQIRARNSNYKNVDTKIAELEAALEEENKQQAYAALYGQAQKYAAARNVEMAIATYESLIEQAGDYKDARAKLETLRRQFEQKQLQSGLESEYAAGMAALKAQEWTLAILSFEKILSQDRSFRDARRRLTEAQRGLNRESNETITARYYADGLTAMNQNDLGRAAAALEKVVKINPNYRNASGLLAEIERMLAQASLMQASAGGAATRADSLYQEAVAAEERADWLAAVVALEKTQVLQPNYRDVADRLAFARASLNLQQAAGLHSQESSRTAWYVGGVALLLALPVLGMMMFSPTMRARIHIFRDNYAAAVKIYENILARFPNRVKLYPRLANLYLLMGRNDERAMKVYKMVLQLNLATRSREEINAIVAQQYLLEGRTDSDAIEVLEDALRAERNKLGAGSRA